MDIQNINTQICPNWGGGGEKLHSLSIDIKGRNGSKLFYNDNTLD